MKSVSVVEVNTTKILHSLFLLKIEENLMFIEKKSIPVNPKNQLVFEVSLFSLILFLHFGN